MSPYFIVIVLLVIIAIQYGFSIWERQLIQSERARLLAQIKDLSDKVYFTKTHDFLTHEALEDPTPPPTTKTEEEYVPFESMTSSEIAKAFESQHG